MNPPRPGSPWLMMTITGVLGLIVVGAGVSHYTGSQRIVLPPSTAVAERDLTFTDLTDGGVEVRDARTGGVVAELEGQNGFLRATVRGLAQQRLREDSGSRAPFRLTAWADNRLTLDDPVTGRHIELEAFGATNEEVFAQLLAAKEAGQ